MDNVPHLSRVEMFPTLVIPDGVISKTTRLVPQLIFINKSDILVDFVDQLRNAVHRMVEHAAIHSR